MNKVLTVCLPTYNRLNFIKRQLQFFESEILANKTLLERINFIVADNCSNDGTIEFFKEIKNAKPFFNFTFNQKNLGLVGNIINLLHLSQTEYVWFVSDDDEIEAGVLIKILDIIDKHNGVNFIYLNYLINKKKGFVKDQGFFKEPKKVALELFNEGYGSLVFMTSCVYKKNNLLELSNSKMFSLLSAPMFYSFYSLSKGNAYITGKAWINFRMGHASYAGFKRNLKLKFEEYISILEALPSMGYDEIEVNKTIRHFFKYQSHSHLLYSFVNFSNSIKLYKKYYTFKSLLLLPSNIINYVKK